MSGITARHTSNPIICETLEARILLSGSITGTIYQDLNGDGIGNPGEPGVPGVTVYLDAERDGVADAWNPQVVTDANGVYTFTGLPDGEFNVRTAPNEGWEALPMNRLIGLGSWNELDGIREPDGGFAKDNWDHYAALWEIDPKTGFTFNRVGILSGDGVDYNDRNFSGLTAVPGRPGVYLTTVQVSGWGLFFDADVEIVEITWQPGTEWALAEYVDDADPFDAMWGGGVDFDPTGNDQILYGGPGDTYEDGFLRNQDHFWTYDFADEDSVSMPSYGDWGWSGDIQFD